MVWVNTLQKTFTYIQYSGSYKHFQILYWNLQKKLTFKLALQNGGLGVLMEIEQKLPPVNSVWKKLLTRFLCEIGGFIPFIRKIKLNQAEGTGLGTQAYDSKSRDAFVQVEGLHVWIQTQEWLLSNPATHVKTPD